MPYHIISFHHLEFLGQITSGLYYLQDVDHAWRFICVIRMIRIICMLCMTRFFLTHMLAGCDITDISYASCTTFTKGEYRGSTDDLFM